MYAGLTARELHSLRHIKQRIERERARPETEEQMDIKLGPGGISDVEFIVQKLQLQYGLQHEDICRPNTREAIEALARASILTEDDACTRSSARASSPTRSPRRAWTCDSPTWRPSRGECRHPVGARSTRTLCANA
ncbi:MAG: hypothetical protein ACE5O2_09805 [Armatimonadota bacterium]